jgi:uncharacterized membrane protein YkoI
VSVLGLGFMQFAVRTAQRLNEQGERIMRNRATFVVGAMLASGIAVAWAAEEKIGLDQLPAKVSTAAKAKFPAAKIVSAEKEEDEGKTVYELAIENNGSKIDLTLDGDGTIVEIEREMKEQELPPAVRDSLSTKYPDGQLKTIEEVTEGNSTSFEFVVVQTTEVKLDAQGKVIKEEHKKSSSKKD